MRWLSLFLLLGLPLFGGERDVVRTFPALPGCSLAIATFRGAITVVESDSDQVRIAVHVAIGADDPREAEELYQRLQLDFRIDGAAIAVTARDPQQSKPRFTWNEKKQVEPTFRVTVPHRCNLDLQSRNGAIIVGRIVGNVAARSGNGDVFFRWVRGTAQAFAAAGDVVLSHVEGSATAECRLGSIRIGTVTGACVAKNASGDVEVLAPKSDVQVSAVAGSATASFPHDFRGRANIQTSGGSIFITVNPKASCTIDARAGFFGHVVSDLALQNSRGSSGDRRVRGSLNGGASPIVLRASGGVIHLKAGEGALEDSDTSAPRRPRRAG